ncbi:MAG: hypothetical protein ACLGHC_06875 [Alphaproteobacteria bacterium]
MDAKYILQRLTQRLYGSPVIRNDARGELVEEIVAAALEPDWQLRSGDWGACDLVHPASKLRIQVKQSAARQSWHKENGRQPKPCFSIKEKTGRWEDGDRWVEERSRNADIFIFAWHPVTDDTADHRDPHQWQFFVVAERDLPVQKSISLTRVMTLSDPVSFNALPAKVGEVFGQLV